MQKFKIAKIFFFLAIFLFFLLPPTDPDLGWHLRCGQGIWQEHSLCSQNQFSVLLPNYSWPNHFWLYQAILFPVYKFAGLWGLSFFNAAIVTFAFFFFYESIKNFTFEKMLAIFAIIFFGWGVFSLGIRGQLIGFLFFNLLLFLVSQIKQKPKLAFFIPLTMLVWANMHGSFVLGLALLGLFWLKETFNFFSTQSKNVKFFIFCFLFFVCCFLVTLLNPFGIHLYQEAWQHFAGPIDLSKLIAEWVPPNPTIYWTVLLSGLGFMLYLLIAAPLQEIVAGLFILLFMFLGLKARRHVHFHFVILSYFFFNLSTSRDLLSSWGKRKELRTILAFLTTIIFLGMGLFFRLPRTYRTNQSWGNYCQASPVTLPNKAVEFLKKQISNSEPLVSSFAKATEDNSSIRPPRPPVGGLRGAKEGNIFNRYEWGGFLIWQLPDYKVFVDGRMAAWAAESAAHALRRLGEGGRTSEVVSPYTIYLEILQTQQGWEETLNEYNIGWILISPGTFMDLLLEPNPEDFGWLEVYRDKISVIYKRAEIVQ